MNYIVTKDREYFKDIGDYNFCELGDIKCPKTIAFDTETTGLNARNYNIFCIQIGTGVDNYIVKMYDGDYCFEDIIPIIQNCELIGHNLLFDLGFCYKHNFYPKKVKDTMLASKILYNGDYLNIKHDFGTCMLRELNVYYDKTEQKNIHLVKLSQPSTIKYSFNDVDRLLELHDVLENKIIDGGFKATYELHCRYIKALAYMEQCGLPISSIAWKNKIEEDLNNNEASKNKIKEYIYDNIPKFRNGQLDMFNNDKKIKVSLTSPIQMVKVFNELGINTLDKDGKNSINESIISKSKHEFVKLWLDFQESNHRISTFGEGIYNQIKNERIYTSFNPMVDTARISSRKGSINFLNFPSDSITRNCFIANEGNDMIVCDYSGQETVIAADLSGDRAMTKSVTEGADLHCLLARVLFPELEELTDDDIKKNHKSKRDASKAPRFAMSYGGNAYTLHVNEGIPTDRAVEIEEGFKELHEGLYYWGAKVFERSIKTGYIESVDGWKLKLPKFDIFQDYKKNIESISKEEWTLYKEGKNEYKRWKQAKENKEKYFIENQRAMDFYQNKKMTVSNFFKLRSEYERLCLNNPVQTRGAHQLKLATSLLFEWILEENLINKVKICNSPYDEIVLESNKEFTPIATKKLEECMIKAGNYYLTKLKIQAEAKSGESWGKAK